MVARRVNCEALFRRAIELSELMTQVRSDLAQGAHRVHMARIAYLGGIMQ